MLICFCYLVFGLICAINLLKELQIVKTCENEIK